LKEITQVDLILVTKTNREIY